MPIGAPEVSLLRAEAAIAIIRAAYVLVLGSGLLLLAFRRIGARWVVMGVLLGNVAAWSMATLPLDRLYAVGCSSDRMNNLGFCQVVAAGSPILETAEVGRIHFEPFWSALMALLAGFEPDRVSGVYAVMPLIAALAFALALYCGLRAPSKERAPGADAPWCAWERACVAGFATLLSAAPLDHLETFRNPWALTFMLKPNHALALALTPLFVWALVRADSWRRLVAAGLVLHLIGWVFVLHMAYIIVALATLLALAAVRRDWARLRRETIMVTVVAGVTVAIVSPYLVMLLWGYPFTVPSASATIPGGLPLFLATTLRLGWIFWLGVWGLHVVWRRDDRLARVWEALVIGGYVVWILYVPLSLIQRAREMDEIYFWIRFLMAGSAGIGAWDLLRRTSHGLASLRPAHTRMALLGLIVLPSLMPSWWNPLTMDSYFPCSLAALPEVTVGPTRFLRHQTDPDSVIASAPAYAQRIPALAARRVLYGLNMSSPSDAQRRVRFQEQLVRGDLTDEVRHLRQAWSVDYLLVDDQWIKTLGDVSLDALMGRPDLELVHTTGDPDGELVAIFRLVEVGQR